MIRLVQVGLGPMGRKVVQFALERGGFKFVGAVDPAPELVGRDLGDACGLKRLGVRVSNELAGALKGRDADAAILTTVSSLRLIRPQVESLAAAGLSVVSTCEELVFPWRTDPATARAIDAAFRRNGVSCLSTGVNPGFLMDFLPCVLTCVSQRVDRIVVHRVQDASVRRVPFQQKIGAGLTRAQFARKKASGTLRHVGLTESMHMIAARLGWKLTRTSEILRPVVARRKITSGHVPIMPGAACGVEQIGRAFVGRREVIRLVFRAAVGEPESFDSVEIHGQPSFKSLIPGGVNGDVATTAIVLNAVPFVLAAEPGLLTMLDLPAPAWSV